MKAAFVVFCTFSFLHSALCFVSSGVPCDSYELVQYRLTFIGDWSEEKFPKQYPKFRPHAQWSKLIGRTHNNDYNLWSVGKEATSAFKKFAQEAASDDLDKKETQGFNGIFDAFTAPAINAGIGESAVDVFVKNTHSMVSAAVRLVPSPDWFVGINGIQLCVNGSWLYETMIPLDPIDAGTDRGYTFTSPKWASRPRQAMYQITSKFPNHRANSFYYPELDALPHISYIKFELLTSNRQHKVHHQVGHVRRVDDDADEIDPEKKREELEEQQILHGEPLLPGRGNDDERVDRVFAPPPTFDKPPTAAAVRLRPRSGPAPRMQPVVDDDGDEAPANGRLDEPIPYRPSGRLGTRTVDNRLAADQSRTDSRQQSTKEKLGHAKRGQHQKPRQRQRQQQWRDKLEEKQDCEVSDWSHWSACSKTCGFGAQKRTRKVIQTPRYGRPCPPLEQEKWCGSMRTCRDEQKLFSWLQSENSNGQGRGRA